MESFPDVSSRYTWDSWTIPKNEMTNSSLPYEEYPNQVYFQETYQEYHPSLYQEFYPSFGTAIDQVPLEYSIEKGEYTQLKSACIPSAYSIHSVYANSKNPLGDYGQWNSHEECTNEESNSDSSSSYESDSIYSPSNASDSSPEKPRRGRLTRQKAKRKYNEDSEEEEKENRPKKKLKGSGKSSNEFHENVFIDTFKLAHDILHQLRKHRIPQVVFANKIIERSQGTLSDLLKNPKPWDSLKSGQETYRKMYDWLKLPLHERLDIFNYDDNPEKKNPKKMKKDKRGHRFMFTEKQKVYLEECFERNSRPSQTEQKKIAKTLRLSFDTIHNFFANSRRKMKVASSLF